MLCRSIFCLVNFVIVLLAITGCTDIVVSQRMGEVIIRDGQNPTPKHGDVGQMAADILPYALIADQTYRDGSYRRQAPLKPYPPLMKCSPLIKTRKILVWLFSRSRRRSSFWISLTISSRTFIGSRPNCS